MDVSAIPGRQWWHRKGHYVVYAHQIIGEKWISYFIEENCDDTHQAHANAESGESLVYRDWFESNHFRVMSIDRFTRTFSNTPVKIVPKKIVQYNADGHAIIAATPDPIICQP